MIPKVKLIAATENPRYNHKMLSYLVDVPTVLLAELRTHRIITQGNIYEHSELIDFNLSANSARAIPYDRYLNKILENPYIPMWTKQQKGMTGELIEDHEELDSLWLDILNQYIIPAYNKLINSKVHKQNANRLLAPFAYTTCIISGTEWLNFFNLRCPKYTIHIDDLDYVFCSKTEVINFIKNNNLTIDLSDNYFISINKSTAQPELQAIAEAMYDLYLTTTCTKSEYHIPFKKEIELLINNYSKNNSLEELYSKYFISNLYSIEDNYIRLLLDISASMCAKISYNNHELEEDLEKHLSRAKMLFDNKHYEPFSHQAKAMNEIEYDNIYLNYATLYNNLPCIVKQLGRCYNLVGFISYRYILENLMSYGETK